MRRLLILVALLALLVACAKPVPSEHLAYVGQWRGDGMTLTIDAGGNARYERKRDGMSSSVSGPVHDFRADGFKIGIGPLSADFEVQRAPGQVNGGWRMTVDGVELSRVDKPALVNKKDSVSL